MIKVFCNKCGKEITGNVNTITEETEAIDCEGNIVAKWADTIHYCDKCQQDELTCGFKVGDKVITSTGKVGKITNICTCDYCKERGFYEPTVEVEVGNGPIWITNNDKECNFYSFYQIGDHIFGNIDEQCVFNDIQHKKDEIRSNHQELRELEAQLDMVKKLKNN